MSRCSALPTADSPLSSRLDSLETTLHDPNMLPALGVEVHPADLIVAFRHSGWADRRRCVRSAMQRMSDTAARRDRFDNCGRNAWVLRSLDDPEIYRIACDKCKDRFCTPCASERARSIGACVGEFAEKRVIRFITLTLRQSKRGLREDVNRLYAAFVKLRRRAIWRNTQVGGVYFLEMKRRRGGDGWHTHMHILSEGQWLSKSWLSHAWQEVTGDSYIVDIRLCDSSERAAQYVAKYAGKGVHGSCYHEPLVLLEAMRALKGRRLVGKWGEWSALDLDREIPEGAWERVATLQVVLERCRRGEHESLDIMQSLGGKASVDNDARASPGQYDLPF